MDDALTLAVVTRVAVSTASSQAIFRWTRHPAWSGTLKLRLGATIRSPSQFKGEPMSRRIAAAAVALSIALLAGCGGDEPSRPPSSDLTPSSERSNEAPSEPLSKGFGETFTWDDDVAITMSKPKPFTSSADALQPNMKGVVLDVTVRNGSDQPIEVMSDVILEPKSGGEETTPIQDKTAGVDLPEEPVPAGESVKFKVAFSPGDDLTVGVQHGYGNAEGIYE